jgi:hypothetical protein
VENTLLCSRTNIAQSVRPDEDDTSLKNARRGDRARKDSSNPLTIRAAECRDVGDDAPKSLTTPAPNDGSISAQETISVSRDMDKPKIGTRTSGRTRRGSDLTTVRPSTIPEISEIGADGPLQRVQDILSHQVSQIQPAERKIEDKSYNQVSSGGTARDPRLLSWM